MENEGPSLTLEEAVSETLRSSQELRLAQARTEEREGALQESSGLFDGSLFADLVYSYEQDALIRGEIGQEIRRRVPMEFAAIAIPPFGPPGALDRAADQLEAAAPGARTLIVDECRNLETQFIIETPDSGTSTLCLDRDGILQGVVVDDTAISSEDLDELLDVLYILEVLGQDRDQEIEDNIRQALLGLAGTLRDIAEALRFQRALLAGLPSEGTRRESRFELGYRHLFHTGLGLTASINLQGTEMGFDGKVRDPNRGGSLVPTTFTTGVGLRLDIPLARGRGRIATGGSEEAASLALDAERNLLLHTAAEQSLTTVRAYWNLAAELERAALLEESVAARGRYLGVVNDLVDAGERPGSDSGRAIAQLADAERDFSEAQGAVANARFDLVEAMGIQAGTLDETPLPATSLPAEAHLGEASPWSDAVIDRRFDLAAAANTTAASALLEEVSRVNLRRQVDLIVSVSYSGFLDTFDKGLFDFDGYWDAANGRLVGPSYSIGLRIDLPFGNQRARGRLIQATAARAQSEISEGVLARQVRLQVADLAATLSSRRTELQRIREADGYLSESLRSSDELFRIGDISLLDLLTTEQQLVSNRLASIEIRREIALLEAAIRFESGTLLRDKGRAVEDFDPVQFELAEWPKMDATPAVGP
ncbi:MAG: TolC family protein [Thermoanaerobaculia bacterium]|nr:TolC family protein [Thermoanaerobaculia bacterium]